MLLKYGTFAGAKIVQKFWRKRLIHLLVDSCSCLVYHLFLKTSATHAIFSALGKWNLCIRVSLINSERGLVITLFVRLTSFFFLGGGGTLSNPIAVVRLNFEMIFQCQNYLPV